MADIPRPVSTTGASDHHIRLMNPTRLGRNDESWAPEVKPRRLLQEKSCVMTNKRFASQPDFTPSIIVGWKPNMTVACGPHGTTFTGTGFGWCYGRKANGSFISFDFDTGTPMPITEVLVGHSDFKVFADYDDGFELLSLERYISVITRANSALMITQALLSNPAIIELAEFGNAGTAGTPAEGIEFDPSDDYGPFLVRKNGNPITKDPPAVSEWIYLGSSTILHSLRLNLPEQRLIVPAALIPLIDCPGLSFTQKLRQQLAAAYPDRRGPWTIAAQGFGRTTMTVIDRPRPFITDPHAFHRHPAGRPTRPYEGFLEVVVKDRQIIAKTDDWHFDGDVKVEDGIMQLHFDAVAWSVLAWRADLRHGIVDKVRTIFRTGYDIELRGFDD